MKLSVAVIMILSTVLLYPSSGFSQQAAGSLPRSSRNNAALG